MVPGPNFRKNGARPQFPEWCQAPIFQKWCQAPIFIAGSETTWQSLKKRKSDERKEVNEYAF